MLNCTGALGKVELPWLAHRGARSLHWPSRPAALAVLASGGWSEGWTPGLVACLHTSGTTSRPCRHTGWRPCPRPPHSCRPSSSSTCAPPDAWCRTMARRTCRHLNTSHQCGLARPDFWWPPRPPACHGSASPPACVMKLSYSPVAPTAVSARWRTCRMSGCTAARRSLHASPSRPSSCSRIALAAASRTAEVPLAPPVATPPPDLLPEAYGQVCIC